MQNNKWGFWLLTAIVVGNMVGSGVFMLPSTLANTASPLGALYAWLVTGFGVLMIALVFGQLSIRRPDLAGGPQNYARAIFSDPKKGKLASFTMVWGYWVANWISNVAVVTSLAGYITTFIPILTDKRVLFETGDMEIQLGQLLTFLLCTILLWGTHIILVTSFNAAGKINFLTTFAKVAGFALFIIAGLFVFQTENFNGFYYPVEGESGTVLGLGAQVHNAAISTLWAFVGIESAVILSGRASSQRDVKRATVTGLIIALCIYLIITLITMGALPVEVLRASDKPFVDVLAVLIGSLGGVIMGILAIMCLAGSMLGWILLSSELPYQSAKAGDFPTFFAKVNRKGSPANSLLITNLMSQIFIFSTISGTISQAFDFLTTSATLAYLIPYLVSAIYFLKIVFKGETYSELEGSRIKDGAIALLAIVYSLWVIATGTADMITFGLGVGLFLAGVIIYPFAVKKFAAK
ncbi:MULTISPECIES: amino acid permease [Bacillus]|uniref:Arginine:ornithine antiporter n=2 Tax=Bacillus TaxID=1386 RepID=A0A0M4FV10_9BACI|nr:MULTISPECIES: amino acid permease [Bacillus]ALC82330.1 arginine:ornithine antiporter [Bacillus gobiensis]MBP1081196.1 arginine:ornithine antiporter/lysine permease [Bacillus capparidis]MED1095877.1 amino acid permease [Bacillus capparidis]